MDREIEFRGQDLTSERGWVYGDLMQFRHIPSSIKSIDMDLVNINKDTIGQFTGLCDNSKAKNKIFENDILKMWIDDCVEPDGGIWHYMFVKWTIEKGFVLWAKRMTIEYAVPLYQMLQEDEMEVVGNIHDNDNLL